MGGCPSPEEDILIVDEQYIDDQDMDEKHVVGTTSCPQNLGDRTVYQSGDRKGLEPMDSAVFYFDHQAIDVYCNDDKQSNSCTFENSTENKLSVEFNCGQNSDVYTEVKCDFYRNDTLQKSQTMKVNLLVN